MTSLTTRLFLAIFIAAVVMPINATENLTPSRLINEGRYQEAFTLLMPRAKAGDAAAQVQLGSMFEGGLGLPATPLIAAHWYLAAATQGDAHGQTNLGVLYQYGSGVDQNLATARKWFKKAAAQGYPRGEGKLAYLYLIGEGGKQDTTEAMRLLESAAAGGYAEAQYNLGVQLRQNPVKEGDQARAIALLQQAADQEMPLAMNAIAVLHLSGELIKDMPLSYRLLQRAVTLGFEPAKNNLARLCAQSPEICDNPK